jgi:hypothetical protein
MSENAILEPALMTEIREMAVIVDAFIPEFSAKIRHPSSNTVGEWYSFVDEIEARRSQACDETISPMSRSATVILHRLESERSLTQLATNVQASGNAASLMLKAAAGQYLDAEKDLLSRAPGVSQARWHTIDDLSDASKAFSQDISGLYRLNRDNPVVQTRSKTLIGTTVAPPAAGVVTQHFSNGQISMATAAGPNYAAGVCSGHMTIGYTETIASTAVDHSYAFVIPNGSLSMRLRLNHAYVSSLTGVPVGSTGTPTLTYTVNGTDVAVCGNAFTVVERPVGPSFTLRVVGTPPVAAGVQAYAFTLVLDEAKDFVGNGITETRLSATLASRDHGYDWSVNDRKILSIVRDYEAFMTLKETAFQPFTDQLMIAGVQVGTEAYDPNSWIHNAWGGTIVEVNRVFVKFARRVNVALRLAALDCDFGQEQGVG